MSRKRYKPEQIINLLREAIQDYESIRQSKTLSGRFSGTPLLRHAPRDEAEDPYAQIDTGIGRKPPQKR